MSQPAREFIVKIVETSLWSGDFLLAHVLLMILTPPILIPFIDRLHSTMLCKFSLQRYKFYILIFCLFPPVWLRPSKQIRAPLFSTKQKRQRRWIVSFNTVRVRVVPCLPKPPSGCEVHLLVYPYGRIPPRFNCSAYVGFHFLPMILR